MCPCDIRKMIDANATAVRRPGGSMKNEMVIAAADDGNPNLMKATAADRTVGETKLPSQRLNPFGPLQNNAIAGQ